MTGFQSHPGIDVNAMGDASPTVDIAALCGAIGAKVVVGDPFALQETRETLNRLMEGQQGVKVLILKQSCALSPEKKGTKRYLMKWTSSSAGGMPAAATASARGYSAVPDSCGTAKSQRRKSTR
jgi:indolepyruvate ferredoxin oxidoreductase alpha subunit